MLASYGREIVAPQDCLLTSPLLLTLIATALEQKEAKKSWKAGEQYELQEIQEILGTPMPSPVIHSSPAPYHSSTVPQKRSIVICIWTGTYITKIRVSSLSWVSLQIWLNLIIMTALGSITKVETETWNSHRVRQTQDLHQDLLHQSPDTRSSTAWQI